MILYLLGYHTDQYMNVLYQNDDHVVIDGMNVYVEDGVSNITPNNRRLLNILYDLHSILPIFEYSIFNSNIKVYAYYTEIINKKCIVYIRTDSMTIESKPFSNHCLAYIDILLQLHNVHIDLTQFEK